MAITCTTTKSSFTDNELNQTFGDANVTGVLPATPSTDRDSSGMINTAAITRIITSLKTAGIVPEEKPSDTEGYV